MRHFLKHGKALAKNEEGVAYIELALSVFVLLTLLMGSIEVASFIRVKNKMNQVADQLGQLLSTIPGWRPETYVEPVINAGGIMARPFGVSIDVRFCAGGTGTDIPYSQVIGEADCSLGTQGASGTLGVTTCDDSQVGTSSMMNDMPTIQFVTVNASCRFKPYINYLGFFDNVVVQSVSVTPMRYTMQW